LKDYAKRLVDNHRNDMETTVLTDKIEAPGGASLIINDTTFAADGTFTCNRFFTIAPTTSSGAAAVPITSSTHEITTSGIGDALTLVDGTAGQHLMLVYVAEGAGTDTAILTPTTLAGASTTITFNAVGDSAHLIYTSVGWAFLGGNAVVA